MSAIAAAVVMGGATIYAASKASSASKAASAANERAAQGLTQSADYAADLSYKLGQEQLGFARQQYDEMKPLAQRVYDQQLQAQEEQMRQARDYYDYQTQTFRPLEQGLVADAQNFDTEAYRNQLAAKASQDAAQAFGLTQGMVARESERRGVNPNSGAAAGLQNQSTLNQAAMRAGGMNNARTQAENTAYARKLDVTGLGRNLAGASTAAYGAANASGTAGINTAMAPGSQYSSAVTPAFNTMMTGSGQRIQGYGNMFAGTSRSMDAANAAEQGLYGTIAGGAGRFVGYGMGQGKFG
jgi:hypothetical protein